MLRVTMPLQRSLPGLPVLIFALAFAMSSHGTAFAANDAYSATGKSARADDAYRPPADNGAPAPADDAYRPDIPAASETYEPAPPQGGTSGAYRSLDGSRRETHRPPAGEYGAPYQAPEPQAREEHYETVPAPAEGGPAEASGRGYYTQNEIVDAGHGFFGSVSQNLAGAIEWAFQKGGRPNGYILGQDAGGAVIAGVRYGEGILNTKDAGTHKVFWQGPTVGYDLGAEGSKVMVLVYNLRDPSEIYQRFAGVQGAAYLVGGVGVQLQKSGDVTLAPIRSGVGVRLGANIGYLKYTRNPTWNPF